MKKLILLSVTILLFSIGCKNHNKVNPVQVADSVYNSSLTKDSVITLKIQDHQTMVSQIKELETIHQYVTISTEGNISVKNDEGFFIFRGNIHKNLQKSKVKTYSQLFRENMKLNLDLINCSKDSLK